MLIAYYLMGWLRLPEFVPGKKHPSTRISVIIAARNEEKNIADLLNDLKEQTYGTHLFEVIVADDFSTDKTADIVRRYQATNISLLELKAVNGNHTAGRPNKKAAIEAAVAKATGELIITTDADCHVGNNWLFTVANYYEQYRPVMVAGMVNYFPDSSFLGKFQTLDFLSLVGIAAASTKNGFYNLCNGANLAYTKEAFIAVEGFRNIDHVASGDDMMLMHKMAKKFPHKIAYLKNKEAIVYTQTTRDFSAFWHQRVRWTSKSVHYEDKRITAILSFAYLFNLLILVNLIIGLFVPAFLKIATWQFLAKICIDTIFTYAVTRFFRRENLLWLFLPIQTIHILYIVLIAPAGIFGRYKWKDRKI